MLCENCQDEKATVHLTEILDGEKTESHLCEDCAREAGHLSKPSPAELLEALMGGGVQLEELQKLARTRCPECGISYAEFKKVGRLGCPEDYDVFEQGLEPLLDKVHGATQHEGRRPPGAPDAPPDAPETPEPPSRLQRLRDELQAAVAQEEYERAAELRDEIRSAEDTDEDDAGDAGGDDA